MAKPTAEEAAKAPHALTLDARRSLALTGVMEVLAFDETQIALKTGAGEMTISGESLHVKSLLLEDGKMTVEGRVDALVYAERTPRAKGRLRALLR